MNWTSDSAATLKSQRARCTTCTDAFIAPDASTLATQLQSIIDQGASDGDFNAQQSITESVFEYVDRATTATLTYSALSPSSRYQAITPTRFVSSFSLPGFKGQLKAYQNDGSGNAVLRWSAGDKLWTKVSTAMSTCNNSRGRRPRRRVRVLPAPRRNDGRHDRRLGREDPAAHLHDRPQRRLHLHPAVAHGRHRQQPPERCGRPRRR